MNVIPDSHSQSKFSTLQSNVIIKGDLFHNMAYVLVVLAGCHWPKRLLLQEITVVISI